MGKIRYTVLFFCLLLLVLIFLALFVTIRVRTTAHDHRSRPNVLFIVLDAARADRFSCYGYGRNTTPRMDTLSKEGMLFLHHFSNATWTLESVPQYLFSRYFTLPIAPESAWEWGIKRETPHAVMKEFDPEQILLPEVFARNGYRTVLFHGHAYFTEDTYVAQKFDESYYIPNPDKRHIGKKMIAWIEENKSRNFFIYTHIMAPHAPYSDESKDEEFLKNEDPGFVTAVMEKVRLRKDEAAETWSKEELEVFGKLYDGKLKHIDRCLGTVFDYLEENNLTDNTLIVITADHGEGLGQHNYIGHRKSLPWDSVIHIPLIISYPPLTKGGVTVDALTEAVDVMPTILSICGLELPEHKSADGVDLLEAVRNTQKEKQAVFTTDSIRTRSHKYMYSSDLLFDLREGSEETHDVATEQPAVRAKLRGDFEAFSEKYRQRMEASRRNAPPDYPFYFALQDFAIEPVEAYQTCHYRGGNFYKIVWDASPTGPWLLSADGDAHGLFCLPQNGSPAPLALSAPLPNGSYQVILVTMVFTEEPFSFEKSDLLFRFNSFGLFAEAPEVKLAKSVDKDKVKILSYFFDLGKTVITEEQFYLQIRFRPTQERLYVFRLIKFIPLHQHIKDTDLIDEEELERRKERLRSLGYL